MKRRGQAAMEFLMTYGWAILAAVIVVGVLWYLIGNPSNLAGNNFQIAAPLVGEGVLIQTSGVSFEIRNGDSESMTVTGILLTNCGTGTAGLSTSVAAGAVQSFTETCSLTGGDRFNGDLTINYTSGSSSFVNQATGRISGRVP